MGLHMKKTVTLKLTEAEAMALDELVSWSVGILNDTYDRQANLLLEDWDRPATWTAWDKLRAAVLGPPSDGK